MYKNDFPILVKNPGITYLDSASSTQKPKYVIDKVSDYITSSYANIGRGSYLLAEKSDTYYFGAKEKVAKMIHCKANELFFSYNATYCINTIALSLATSGYLQEGGEIILSITEHHANILIWQQLATQYKLTIKWLDLHTDYTFNLPQLQELVSTKTLLVCLSLCSNVLGIKNDVRHVRQIIWPECLFLVDASQAIPNYSVDVYEWDYDFLVFSAHKFLAFTGVWVWFIKHNLISKLTPWIFGWGIVEDVSTQSFTIKNNIEKFEPWTPNIIGIVSLYYALEYRESIGGYERRVKYEKGLIDYTLEKCQSLSDKLKCINIQTNNRIWIFSFIPHTTNKTLEQISGHLNQNNICMRSGGHCAYPLAKHLWLTSGSLRLSLYIYNTKEDIDVFFQAIDNYL